MYFLVGGTTLVVRYHLFKWSFYRYHQTAFNLKPTLIHSLA